MKSACITTSHCVSWGAILLIGSGLAAGQSWRQINSGLPVTVGGVLALTFDPATPSVIYAITATGSLFKTSDGGGTWKPISTANSAYSVIVDPKTSANVYAATWGRGILKSPDYGETWTTANTGLQSNAASQLIVVPTDPPALYAVTSGGLFKSTDGAQSWQTTGGTFYAFQGAAIPLASVLVSAVAVDPKNPLTLYATVYSYVAGLFKSMDGGTTWFPASTPLPNNVVALPVFNPQAPSTIYLWYSDYNYPAKSGGGHLLQSTDDGASWNEIGNGGVPPGSYLQNLAFEPKSPSTLYAAYTGDQGWGLVKSTDGGKTWNQLNTGLPPYQTSAIVAVSSTAAVYAGYVDTNIKRGRLVKSTDGGTTWSAADLGLTYIDVRTLAIDPTDAAAVYAGVGGGGEGVFKTRDSGAHWSNLAQLEISGSPAFPTDPPPQGEPGLVNSLLIDSFDPKVIYAATGRINGSCIYTDKLFFKSTDGGTIWDNIANPPQGGCGFFFWRPVMALAPTDSNELYLGGGDGCGDSWLDQSPNGGSDWNSHYIDDASEVVALVVDPVNPSTLYAGTDQGVFKSSDGGAHWTNAALNMGVPALVIDPSQPNTLYAVTGSQYFVPSVFQGVFKSVDGGGSWSPINTGLDSVIAAGSFATAIAVVPQSPNTLYLATSGSGIYKSSDGGSHWAPFNEHLTNLDVRVLAVASSGLNKLYAATPGGVFAIVDEPMRPLTPRR